MQAEAGKRTAFQSEEVSSGPFKLHPLKPLGRKGKDRNDCNSQDTPHQISYCSYEHGRNEQTRTRDYNSADELQQQLTHSRGLCGAWREAGASAGARVCTALCSVADVSALRSQRPLSLLGPQPGLVSVYLFVNVRLSEKRKVQCLSYSEEGLG